MHRLSKSSVGRKTKEVAHHFPFVSVAIIWICVSLFLIFGPDPKHLMTSPTEVMDHFSITVAGKVLLSSYLHFSWEHIAWNCLILLGFGFALEEKIGHLRMAALALTSSVLASALVFILGYPSPVLCAGASDMVYGMMGAYVFLR